MCIFRPCRNWFDASAVDKDLTLLFCSNKVFNNLSGTLPHELQGLDGLLSLHLPDNNIQGTIPWLGLTNTIFKRELGVVSLQFLTLSANQLTGTIDEVGQFDRLATLWLGNNLLTGQIPSELADDALVALDLSSNMLSGTIPINVFQMEQLYAIFLGNNNFWGNLPNNIRLPTLSALSLDENSLSGSIPDSIGELTSLEFFWTFRRTD